MPTRLRKRAEPKLTKSSQVLLYLVAAGSVVADIVTFSGRLNKYAYYGGGAPRKENFEGIIYYLLRKGLIKVEHTVDNTLISLTEEGRLEALLAKARMPTSGPWDGKWRLIIFDIPEDAHAHRDKLRWLLKHNQYVSLQASVYISPYPLNREAIAYLKETGLNKYIRILKVEEIDDDSDIRKKFSLPLNKTHGRENH